MKRAAVHIAFFASGFAGLVYQVVWVRFFGNAFGNTLPSAAIVTSIFMLGLGLGSWVGGRWIDRNEHRIAPARAYAAAEMMIAVLGLALAAILPRMGSVAAAISTYTIGAHGWHEVSFGSHVALGLIAFVALLPATFLMGATLTLLIRHVLRDELADTGWRVAALYGANTGGAALGALATDTLLVPVVGLFATAGCAALANLVAALIAGRLDPPASSPPAEEAEAVAPYVDRRAAWVAGAVFISGFSAMGLEMVWFRFFDITMGSYRAVFSLLLATMLASMWIGSVIGGMLERRFHRPGLLFLLAQTGVIVTSLVLLATHDPEALRATFVEHFLDTYRDADLVTRDMMMAAWQLRSIAAVIAIPAALMGFAYPLANAMVQDEEGRIGGRAGVLYFANTAGNVAGASVTGLVLIGSLGTAHSVWVLAIVGVIALPCVWAAQSEPRSTRVLIAALVASTTTIGAWTQLEDIVARHANPYGEDEAEVLAVSEGRYEIIAVTEHHADGHRRLNTNGHSMSATFGDAERYMRLFSHFPLLHIEDPEHVLVICFGVGNTLHSASLHPSLKTIEIADLSRNVLEHASYFEKWNHDVLSDPRVDVYVQDGRTHLRSRPEDTYDLVTLEPPPPKQPQVSALYTQEFYELARSRLKPGGFVTQWLPARQFPGRVTLALIRAFLEVFPDAILLTGAQAELILVGRHDAPLEIELGTLLERIESRPAVAADLRHIRAGTPLDFVGTFAAGPGTLQKATRGVPPLTDDYPILEYAARSKLVDFTVPAKIFNPFEIRKWCVDCVEHSPEGRLVANPRLAGLREYLSIMHAVLTSQQVRHFNTLLDRQPTRLTVVFPPGITPQSPLIIESPYLRSLFWGAEDGVNQALTIPQP